MSTYSAPRVGGMLVGYYDVCPRKAWYSMRGLSMEHECDAVRRHLGYRTAMNRTRRSPRLADYDYGRPGLYFVTVCIAGRACVFGEVEGGSVVLSALGRIAHDEWGRTLALRPDLSPDVFVVMPNHVHLLFGIPGGGANSRRAEAIRRAEACLSRAGDDEAEASLSPTNTDGAGARRGHADAPHGVPPQSVPAIVGGYKAAVTRRARVGGLWPDAALWQARFHDRIVRDQDEADRIRRYIARNPAQWAIDALNP